MLTLLLLYNISSSPEHPCELKQLNGSSGSITVSSPTPSTHFSLHAFGVSHPQSIQRQPSHSISKSPSPQNLFYLNKIPYWLSSMGVEEVGRASPKIYLKIQLSQWGKYVFQTDETHCSCQESIF